MHNYTVKKIYSKASFMRNFLPVMGEWACLVFYTGDTYTLHLYVL